MLDEMHASLHCENSRQPQPRGRPAAHEKSRPFLLEARLEDLDETLCFVSIGVELVWMKMITSLPALAWSRLLRTSAGAQSVVAMVPAMSDAPACILMSSWRLKEFMRCCLAEE